MELTPVLYKNRERGGERESEREAKKEKGEWRHLRFSVLFG